MNLVPSLDVLKTKIRQLWEQCDLFEPEPVTPVWERPTVVSPPRRRKKRKARKARSRATRPRRIERTNPADLSLAAQLTTAFQQYNVVLFQGKLNPITIRISRRMKNRLGHYMKETPDGLPAEIAISWLHIQQDPWDDVLHTLIHEMVHQWQDENGLPLDHGPHFRRKAREVGISTRATRQAVSHNPFIIFQG